MHRQRGCRPLLTFTPHDHTCTHNKQQPVSEKISSSSSFILQVPASSSSPSPQPPPRALHSPPLPSLSPWMDSVGCGCVLRAKRDSFLFFLLLLFTQRLSCRYLHARVISSTCASQLWLPAVSPAAPNKGRRLPEEPGGRPLLYQHPLTRPASRFLSGELPVKHTHGNTHTVVGIHFKRFKSADCSHISAILTHCYCCNGPFSSALRFHMRINVIFTDVF